MITEIGHFSLVLALCVAVLQAVLPLYGAARGEAALIAWARPAALAQFLARQCRGQFEQPEAAALQAERGVEQP